MSENTRFYHATKIGNDDVILFHTLTFSYLILKGAEFSHWLGAGHDKLGKSLNAELVKKHFIASAEKDAGLFKKALEIFSKRKQRAPSICAYITTECNMRCPYCFQGSGDSHLTLNAADIALIRDSVKQIQERRGRVRPVIFGGEPLLEKNRHIFSGMMEAFAGISTYPVEIVTNGTMLRKFMPEIKRYEDSIDVLRFTVYGPSGINDRHRFADKGNKKNFQDNMRNIREVLSETRKIKIFLNLLLDNRTVAHVPELMAELRQEGVLDSDRVIPLFGRIQFRCSLLKGDKYPHELKYADYYPELVKLLKARVIPPGSISGSEVELLWKIFTGWESGACAAPNFKGCRAVYPGRYCFYPDGFIYPCTEIAGCKGNAIGEFRPGLRFFESMDAWENYPEVFLRECAECKYIGMCNGACPATNIGDSGRLDRVTCINYKDSLDKFFTELDRSGMLKNV
ncbi:MAG: hypothetical protein A2270_03860 [Elusimicrobia bacterium RIFOXYA12_FULL_51_18]|nr:MAG: hypothetical protein A2270_03860 [Elusimicrobia bacterium RIFOXYA12_FULL_51_18]OGS29887.1 MAG: hypothetical protein A2218_02560 [Elusimicrobia bacterium RIFOXYA2_FULL_53_38]